MNSLELLDQGGPLMVPLGLLSVVALALFLERLWALQIRKVVPDGFCRAVLALLKDHELSGAVRLCHENDSSIARIAREALHRVGKPRDILKEVMEERAEAELFSLERRIGAISTIATVAPLMGLLGTITGMIQVFREVSAQLDPEVSALAGGIWEALITTAAGLLVAIPAYAMHRYLLSLVDARSQDLAEVSMQILEHLEDTKVEA